MDNSKITNIVLLRAIAALSICFVHIQMICDFHVNFFIDYLINNGQQGVTIFFVISGFILPYALYKKNYVLRDFPLFLLTRSIRIDPPYWFIIALLFVTGIVPIGLLNVNSALLHLFYLVPFIKGAQWYSSIFWTLSIEFQFYLLLGLFFPFLMRVKTNVSLLILICIIIVCVLSKLTYRGIIIGSMDDFILGFIAFMVYIKKISLTKGLITLSIIAAFIMVFVSIKSGVLPLLTAGFILLYKNQRKLQPFYFIGTISYSLYLIHGLASTLFVNAVGTYITNKLLLFTGCVLISVLAAYLFYLLVEKRAINFSKKVKPKTKNTVAFNDSSHE